MLGPPRHPGSGFRLHPVLAETDGFRHSQFYHLAGNQFKQIFRVEKAVRHGQRT